MTLKFISLSHATLVKLQGNSPQLTASDTANISIYHPPDYMVL
jgi:hypothetical protein